MKNTIILILQIIILGIVSSCEKNEEGITFVDFSLFVHTMDKID